MCSLFNISHKLLLLGNDQPAMDAMDAADVVDVDHCERANFDPRRNIIYYCTAFITISFVIFNKNS